MCCKIKFRLRSNVKMSFAADIMSAVFIFAVLVVSFSFNAFSCFFSISSLTVDSSAVIRFAENQFIIACRFFSMPCNSFCIAWELSFSCGWYSAIYFFSNFSLWQIFSISFHTMSSTILDATVWFYRSGLFAVLRYTHSMNSCVVRHSRSVFFARMMGNTEYRLKEKRVLFPWFFVACSAKACFVLFGKFPCLWFVGIAWESILLYHA